MVKCMIRKNHKKERKMANKLRKFPMNKWVMSTMISDRKTLRTNKAKLKVKAKQMLISRDKKKANKTLSTTNEKKTSKKERDKTRNKIKQSKLKKNKEVTGTIIMSKDKKLTSKKKMFKSMKETSKI